MSLVDEIYNEVEVLRGLYTALMINYPDTRPRMEPAIAKVDAVLNNPTDQSIRYLIEDMLDADDYFSDIFAMTTDKGFSSSIQNIQELLRHLLGPSERVSLH